MSQVPTSQVDSQAELPFRRSLAMVNQLQRRGHSWSGYERNCCFLNTGGGRFANISAVSGFDYLDDSRAIGVVDWDHDGDLDLWVTNRTGPRVRLLRNSAVSRHHWLALRFQGTASNRDAIGTRVEVRSRDLTGGPLVKTLRAGAGYLAQSSKWMHFGLGSAAGDVDIHIRWPSGKLERIAGLSPNQRYLIVEGSGRAVSRPGVLVEPLAKQPKTEPDTDQPARALMPLPVPLPRLPYESWDGTSRRSVQPGSPVLLNLWASWCQPCQTELQQWAQRKEALDSLGVRVVAVSVDGLESDDRTGIDSAKAIVDQIPFPHQSGVATRELVTKIEVLQLHLFDSQRPLPIPCSLLIDENGALGAFYHGPVDVEQIVQDAASLRSDRATRINHAMPFAGRWRAKLSKTNVKAIASVYRKAGFEEDAVTIYQAALRSRPNDAELHQSLAEIFARHGSIQLAMRHYERAKEFNPTDANTWTRLGLLKLRADAPDEAIQLLRQATELDPAQGDAYFHFGKYFLDRGNAKDSAVYFAKALKVRPRRVEALINLALAEESLGNYSRAIARLERVLEIDPGATYAKNNLAWILATCAEAEFRDSKRALLLATEACQATEYRDADTLDTLAAACAASGDFDSAVRWQKRCIQIAPETRRPDLQTRLKRYTTRKPFWAK